MDSCPLHKVFFGQGKVVSGSSVQDCWKLWHSVIPYPIIPSRDADASAADISNRPAIVPRIRQERRQIAQKSVTRSNDPNRRIGVSGIKGYIVLFRVVHTIILACGRQRGQSAFGSSLLAAPNW